MVDATERHTTWTGTSERLSTRIPPHAYFVVSAIFHYLGPAFAVLLFANVDVLGVAWLRIASAALVFALWRRPWRAIGGWTVAQRRDLVLLGIVLAAMNSCFYLAIARLPLGTVGAIEFVGPIVLAAVAVRSRRNASALGLTVLGAWFLTDVHLRSEPWGLVFAAANCLLFMLYVILGHRIAQDTGGGTTSSIDRLGAAMLVALVVMTPLGLVSAGSALFRADLLLAGAGVGICSSVIPYVCDQLAMARLPRASFALLLALLPATAVGIGIIVLGQIPALIEVGGIACIVSGIILHRTAVVR